MHVKLEVIQWSNSGHSFNKWVRSTWMWWNQPFANLWIMDWLIWHPLSTLSPDVPSLPSLWNTDGEKGISHIVTMRKRAWSSSYKLMRMATAENRELSHGIARPLYQLGRLAACHKPLHLSGPLQWRFLLLSAKHISPWSRPFPFPFSLHLIGCFLFWGVYKIHLVGSQRELATETRLL